MVNNVLVFGKNKEYDIHLVEALKRMAKAGITLNKENCQLSREWITFLGQTIHGSGIHSDPNKA